MHYGVFLCREKISTISWNYISRLSKGFFLYLEPCPEVLCVTSKDLPRRYSAVVVTNIGHKNVRLDP